jgi:hypothetical protein
MRGPNQTFARTSRTEVSLTVHGPAFPEARWYVVNADQGRLAASAIKANERIAEIQKLLETTIDTKGFPEEMSLAQFLARMEAKLPDGKKVTLKIDDEAFGKQLSKVADATFTMPRMKDVSIATVLRKGLAQLPAGVEVDYGIRPIGVVITRFRRWPNCSATTSAMSAIRRPSRWNASARPQSTRSRR